MTEAVHVTLGDRGTWDIAAGAATGAAATFEDIEQEVRALIAARDDVAPSRADFQVRIQAGAADVAAIEDEVVSARARQERAALDYAAAISRAVADLRGAGVRVQDVADILGVTKGRVSQIARRDSR